MSATVPLLLVREKTPTVHFSSFTNNGALVAESHGPQSTSRSLRDELHEIDLPPFKPEWVESYKADQLAKANGGLWRDRLLAGADRIVAVSFWPLVAVAYCGWVISWEVWLGSLAFLVLSGASMSYLGKRIIRDKAVWELVPYDNYQGFIPPHVKAMIEAFGRNRRVEFSIDQLVQNRRRLDPFIVANRGTEAYYIAVWREPEIKYSWS